MGHGGRVGRDGEPEETAWARSSRECAERRTSMGNEARRGAIKKREGSAKNGGGGGGATGGRGGAGRGSAREAAGGRREHTGCGQ